MMRGRPRAWVTVMVTPLLVACSARTNATTDDITNAPDAGNRVATVDPTIAEQLPRIEYLGGPFMRHPRIVTLTFSGDDPQMVAMLERFGASVTGGRWWRQVTDGYCATPIDCVGAGVPALAVRLNNAVPQRLTEADAEDLLAATARDEAWGQVGDEDLLLAYLPEGAQLVDPTRHPYCGRGLHAFHRTLDVDGRQIAYAVVPRCGPLDALTTTASQEVLEATTNPDPHHPGFAFQRTATNAGFTFSGAEPVDICGLLTRTARAMREQGFRLQRAYSNRAAAAGHDPCVPAPGDEPYLALIPAVPILRLAKPGQRATIPLTGASDRPTPGWRVAAIDLDAAHGLPDCVEASLNKAHVTEGAVVSLTVILRRRSPRDLCVVGLVSRLGKAENLWPLAVSTR